MSNKTKTGNGSDSNGSENYFDCSSVSFQNDCVTEHSITNCQFWDMVCSYFKKHFDGTICNPDTPMPDDLPLPFTYTSADMDGILDSYDCNEYAVAMGFEIDPSKHFSNDNIKVEVIPYTIQDSENGSPKEEYVQSIVLFKGLIRQYPYGRFNFYKAIDNVTQIPNVTFYVADHDPTANVLKPNYYCDISSLYP